MNQQIKMSDVFAIPVSTGGYTGGFYDSNGKTILFSDLQISQYVSILKGINRYDQHIELIAKQSDQIKVLREALSSLVSISHENEERLADRMYKDFKESDELLMARKALSATKQK